jgi:hypothetical protein
MKRQIPLTITFFFGMFMIIQYFIPHHSVDEWAGRFQRWAIIVLAFAYVLGVANVLRINLEKVYRRESDWLFKLVTCVSLVGMMVIGLVEGIGQDTFFISRLYNQLYVPMQATMYSTLAFFIASAAYRAFRIRTWHAALLAITAVIVMIGRVPIGYHLWGGFPPLSDWIMFEGPNMVGQRAILIGAALGAISTGLKMVFGIERSYLGGGD